MMGGLRLALDEASTAQIERHLTACSARFVPPLDQRVDIGEYARKIRANAVRFEAWQGGELAGLVALYCNDPQRRRAYVTSVSVLGALSGRSIASRLMRQALEHLRSLRFGEVRLEVSPDNAAAVSLYRRLGFTVATDGEPGRQMVLMLEGGPVER